MIVLDQPGQPEQQHCREQQVGKRDHNPDPPELVAEQLPARMPAHEREEQERAAGGERGRGGIVPCLPRGLNQAGRIRIRLRPVGRIRHRLARMQARSDIRKQTSSARTEPSDWSSARQMSPHLSQRRSLRNGTYHCLTAAASRHSANTNQIGFAWLLAVSPVTLPIPGTATPAHLEDNLGAAELQLDHDEIHAITAALSPREYSPEPR